MPIYLSFFLCESLLELENVFVKHYAPNHIPDPKGECSLKENNSELHYGIHSKVNQFIYILVCNCTPNITILAKAVVGLKTLLLQGLSEPEFYGDLVYKFRKIIGKNDFPYHFKKIVVRYKRLVMT